MKIKILIAAIIIIFSLNYICNRNFIYNSDKTSVVTVWKTFSGKYYIIPYKYYSPFHPKNNFIETTNLKYIYIAWDKKNMLNKTILIGAKTYKKHQLSRSCVISNNHNEFFYNFTGKFYDPTNKQEFNKDSIMYKKLRYEISHFSPDDSSIKINIDQ